MRGVCVAGAILFGAVCVYSMFKEALDAPDQSSALTLYMLALAMVLAAFAAEIP